MDTIFSSPFIYIAKHEHINPWVKIFAHQKAKELTELNAQTKAQVYAAIEICERAMIEFYEPQKINIAMFGNYEPRFHAHVIARFANDEYFPEPMWGQRMRPPSFKIARFEDFAPFLQDKLNTLA